MDGAAGYLDPQYHYARWDGSQRMPELNADDVLAALADDLLEDGDLEGALLRTMRRGMPSTSDAMSRPVLGLDALRRRLAKERKEALSRYRLDDVLGEIRAELESIVTAERRGIERRMGGGGSTAGLARDTGLERLAADVAARRQERLDALPADVGERIRALGEYDFLEPDARDRYQALVARLQGQMLDAAFQGMADAIKGATPEQLAANREMVRDLDRLLQRRLAGDEPTGEEVDAFLAQHGAFFPGARTLDDIVEQLADRMAAMQSLMRSLSPEQRAELDSMMDALLRDDRLRWDLAQLASTLDQLLPGGLGDRMRFRGQEPIGIGDALAQIERIGRMDRLSDQLAGLDDPLGIDEVDDDEVRDLLGADAADDVTMLRAMAGRLDDAGYLERDGQRLQLTPRGARRLGERVLDRLFARLSRDAFGEHALRRTGSVGERAETSSPWEFGRSFDLDLRATLGTAMARVRERVRRERCSGRGRRPPHRVLTR